MPTIEHNRIFWGRGYQWPKDGDEWSVGAGGTPHVWYGTIMPRLCGFLPVRDILEIAPGHGRFTEYLLGLGRVIAVDVAEECARFCARRFRWARWRGRARFHANDGRSLPMVKSGSIDLAFSWDSLVHCERDVMEPYVHELARVLRPGAVALLHHSNLGNYPPDADDQPANPPRSGWRASSMTWQLFQQFCRDAGLWCLVQEPRTFGGPRMIDCISVCFRPLRPGLVPDTQVFHNDEFYRETMNLNRLSRTYARPGATRIADPLGVPASDAESAR